MLTPRDVTGILRLGGTILGTVNRGNPFAESDRDVRRHLATTRTASSRCSTRWGSTRSSCIGGDGTLAIAHQFCKRGIPLVGVPKTIDNDIVGTTNCFGFDTAVGFATDAIDRLHTTAEAHRRIMVVEVMGRYAGWIALHAGVAGGADVILIPEIPFDLATRRASASASATGGAPRFSIVVVAEGAFPKGGQHVARRGGARRPRRAAGRHRRAGVPRRSAELTGKETRSVVLGHLQRGGAPTSFDRVLATRFGGKAVELVRRGQFGKMVAFASARHRRACRSSDVVGKTKTVPLDSDLLLTAKALGVTFGD